MGRNVWWTVSNYEWVAPKAVLLRIVYCLWTDILNNLCNHVNLCVANITFIVRYIDL